MFVYALKSFPVNLGKHYKIWKCTASYNLPRYFTQFFNQTVSSFSTDVRNIGITAHIDAGKTTSTERMLYYSGYIDHMGEIDAGTTVMDYLPSEIERGITVQSAAISFEWLNTQINLIDTPGHVDFTIEVERSLRVLDGAVAIFDASRGVEAQSRTVWRQADRHGVPRVAYMNKMDKSCASFAGSIQSLQEQLKANTLLLQLPISQKGNFEGVVDLVNMQKKIWDMSSIPSHVGRKFVAVSLDPSSEYWEVCLKARASIIEQLCDLYDDVTFAWLEGPYAGDASALPGDILRRWIRKATIDRRVVPVLCGSSYKNVGVQPLLDAIVHYLPEPSDIHHDFMRYYRKGLIAMAFKVMYHKRYGPLVFVRVYSGSLKSNMSVFNPNKSCSETATRLMNVFANELRDAKEITAGCIGVLAGLKYTGTGDTLVESRKHFQEASSLVERSSLFEEVSDVRAERSAVLATVPIPEPVYFCSVEVHSITQEKALESALEIICREDPSVRVKFVDSGFITLSGMGELHMEVIAQRIRQEFKIDAYIGPIQVSYREAPSISFKHKENYQRSISGKKHHVTVDVSIEPCRDMLTITDRRDVGVTTMCGIKNAAALGVIQACQQGPVLGFPVMWAKLRLRSVEASTDCPSTFVSAAAGRCAMFVLENCGCELIEPVMRVEVNTRGSSLQDVVGELRKRHADIKDLCAFDDDRHVSAETPVAELKGFASRIRSITSGLADLSMEATGYVAVSEERFHKIKQNLSGSVS